MTKIIAFANQKGGVAKTTSAIALAQTLAMEGKRILFLDLDPQENASNTLRVNHTPTLYDLMKARKPDDETLNKSFYQLEDNKNITAIRGDIRLASADMEFVFTGREFIVRDIIASELAEAANTKGLPNRYPSDRCGKREHQRTAGHCSLFAYFHSSTGLSFFHARNQA